MPLIVQDHVVGVMDLESVRVGFFTDDHVRTLTLLAPQVASSVENARLYKSWPIASGSWRRISSGERVAALMLPDAEPEIEGLESGRALAPCARNLGRYLRHSRAAATDERDRLRRRERQGRCGGALRRADQRPVANSGAAPAQPGSLMIALNEELIERKVEARYVLC